MHCKAKQMKTLELGAEKCLFQGHARKWVVHAVGGLHPKIPSPLKGLLGGGSSKAFLKGQVRKGESQGV